MTQVIEILPCGRQGPNYITLSISLLLMSWWRKEPGHQQPWYWHSSLTNTDLSSVGLQNFFKTGDQPHMAMFIQICGRLVMVSVPYVFIGFATTNQVWFQRVLHWLSMWCKCKADSRFAPSQWETLLLCNDVSHWLAASLESVLKWVCMQGEIITSKLYIHWVT